MHIPHKKNAGFTLLEIMMVVFVISLLCMIAIPSWMGARERTQTKSCIAQLQCIRDAKDQWGLEYKMGDSATPSWDDLLLYIKTHPACPSGGEYSIGTLSESPTCSFGGEHTLY